MKDCKREGKKQCIWWVTGCLCPEVSPEMKIKCNKEGLWHEKVNVPENHTTQSIVS
jgi:hypothetical protein